MTWAVVTFDWYINHGWNSDVVISPRFTCAKCQYWRTFSTFSACCFLSPSFTNVLNVECQCNIRTGIKRMAEKEIFNKEVEILFTFEIPLLLWQNQLGWGAHTFVLTMERLNKFSHFPHLSSSCELLTSVRLSHQSFDSKRRRSECKNKCRRRWNELNSLWLLCLG